MLQPKSVFMKSYFNVATCVHVKAITYTKFDGTNEFCK